MGIRLVLGNLSTKEIEEQTTELTLNASQAVFQPVATLVMATVGFSAFAEAYNSGGAGPWGSDDVALIDAYACDLRLQIQPAHIARRMAQNWWPEKIEFKCSPLPPLNEPPELKLGAFGRFVFGLNQAMFTSFFEDHRKEIEVAHGKLKHWPEVWAFGKVVRDALSHGGALDIRHPLEVQWKKLSYTPADNGKRIINVDLWPGDLIILLTEMEAALPCEDSSYRAAT